jgi:hypothetical protein
MYQTADGIIQMFCNRLWASKRYPLCEKRNMEITAGDAEVGPRIGSQAFEGKGFNGAACPLTFNSASLQFSELSNFAPFTKHCKAKSNLEIPLHLAWQRVTQECDASVPEPVLELFTQEKVCNSIEAAYQTARFYFIDPEYEQLVLAPLAQLTRDQDPIAAPRIKKLASQASYIPWKQERSMQSKAKIHREYKSREALFHQVNTCLMKHLLWFKFQHAEWKSFLLATHPCSLHEKGMPGYWPKHGDDLLGRLLTQLREGGILPPLNPLVSGPVTFLGGFLH